MTEENQGLIVAEIAVQNETKQVVMNMEGVLPPEQLGLTPGSKE
jgi:hypothetical protein